jgi:hypothetical protein
LLLGLMLKPLCVLTGLPEFVFSSLRSPTP